MLKAQIGFDGSWGYEVEERCGCNCKICLTDAYENITPNLLAGETFCPGPCNHTDEERGQGLLDMLVGDVLNVKNLLDGTEG